MSPARWLRDHPADDRLLFLDAASGARRDTRVGDLPSLVRPGDLVVLNDAATLPASLRAHKDGAPFELRLASRLVDGRVKAVAFGDGSWRTPTEHRASPPELREGDRIVLDGSSVTARVMGVVHGRLLSLAWEADLPSVLSAIYANGRPVQYTHVGRDLPLWAVQTPFATRAWAVEMPSAGRAVGPGIIGELRARGVVVAWLTHAAGLSSTGDAALDAMLPLAEDYEVPEETARAVRATRERGGRVIAVGTTVVRALESAAREGEVVAGVGTATLKLHPGYRRRVVDGILTGFHQEGSTHLELLAAFAPKGLLAETYAHAERAGYLCHELGDVNLVMAA